ncbi:hypothetical protein GTQ34_10710 [Muricauda sp. JGD-17]|uniref:Collagen-like protein n=1 Tax=Flagellimonas ochracea TaxID=2696472 RepID=A0A964TE04_9FLAO|nr:collagen-like protein [Allomuricauda ochracea]NAY92391.1 hypothetical protein [Allomuricauda ochracea]
MKATHLNVLKMAFYLFMGLSITLTSCSGKDGEDGIDGINGIDGEQGPQGPAGEDGNANVVASDWMQIQWDNAIPTEGSIMLEVPELNLSEFVDNGGVVLVYLRTLAEGGAITFSLPFTLNDATFSFYTITNVDTPGIVVLATDPNSNYILDIQNDPDFTLRYVLVPANVAEQNGLTEKTPATFEEVKFQFGLD